MAWQAVRQSQLSFDQINSFLTTHDLSPLRLELTDFEEIYASCVGRWDAILEALGLGLSEEQKSQLCTILYEAPKAETNPSVIGVLTRWLRTQSVQQSAAEEVLAVTQNAEICLFVILSKHYQFFATEAIDTLEKNLCTSGYLEVWMHSYTALGVFDFADLGTGSRFLEAQLRLNATIQREPFWAFAHFASLSWPLLAESMQQVAILQGTYQCLFELEFMKHLPNANTAKEIATHWKLAPSQSLSVPEDENEVLTQVLNALIEKMRNHPTQERSKAIRSLCALIEPTYPTTLDVMKKLDDWPDRAAKVMFLSRAYQHVFSSSSAAETIPTSQIYQLAQAIRSPLENCARIPGMASLHPTLLQELQSVLANSDINYTHPCAEYWALLNPVNPETAPNYAQWSENFKAVFGYERVSTALIRQELQDLQQCVEEQNIPLPMLHHRVRLAQGFKKATQYFRATPYQAPVTQTSLAIAMLTTASSQSVRVFEALSALDILRFATSFHAKNKITVFTVLGDEYDERFGPDAMRKALEETQNPTTFVEWQNRFKLSSSDANTVGQRLTQEILNSPAFLTAEYTRLSKTLKPGCPSAQPENTTIAAHILLLSVAERQALAQLSQFKCITNSEIILSVTLTPSQGSEVTLTAHSTPRDGNCAYTAMGIDRTTSVQLLKNNYESIKEMMAIEIRDEITQLITDISKTYTVYLVHSDETKNTSGVLESKGVEAESSVPSPLQALQSKIQSLCQRWESLFSEDVQLATAELISLIDPTELPTKTHDLLNALKQFNTALESHPPLRETCDAYIEQVVGTDKVWLPFHAAAPGIERPCGLLDALAKVHNIDFCVWAFSVDTPSLTLIAATHQTSSDASRRVHLRYDHNHFEGVTVHPENALTPDVLTAFQQGTFGGTIEVTSEAPLLHPAADDDEEITHKDKKQRLEPKTADTIKALTEAVSNETSTVPSTQPANSFPHS